MKAIVQDRYGPADVLELREIDKPAVPDNDVLVKVDAAGVDPSVWHLMTGLPLVMRVMGFGLRAPKNPVRGLDVSGTRRRGRQERDPVPAR
jgi:NADPH:quinone reductase-like Zn-dependent oxidoreductase